MWVAAVILTAFFPARAADRTALETRAEQEYAGKVLTLRNFYSGAHLSYDADGRLLKGGSPGPWTIDAWVEIEHLKLHSTKLEVDGLRSYVVYNQKLKRFQHVSGSKIKIEVEINPDAINTLALQILMRKIFLAQKAPPSFSTTRWLPSHAACSRQGVGVKAGIGIQAERA